MISAGASNKYGTIFLNTTFLFHLIEFDCVVTFRLSPYSKRLHRLIEKCSDAVSFYTFYSYSLNAVLSSATQLSTDS